MSILDSAVVPDCTFPLIPTQAVFISKHYFLYKSDRSCHSLLKIHHIVPVTLKINPKSLEWFLGATPTYSGIWMLSPASVDTTVSLTLWTSHTGFPLVLQNAACLRAFASVIPSAWNVFPLISGLFFFIIQASA